VSTAFLQEEMKVSRAKAATIVTVTCSIIGAFCSLSLGACDGLSLFGMNLFDIFDFVTGQIFLPIGGLLTCIFIGWVVPRKVVHDEFTNWGTLRTTFFGVYLFLVRFICPVSIVAIFLHQLGVF
jgi:NSS family neurotransmitter:Na+ symporter